MLIQLQDKTSCLLSRKNWQNLKAKVNGRDDSESYLGGETTRKMYITVCDCFMTTIISYLPTISGVKTISFDFTPNYFLFVLLSNSNLPLNSTKHFCGFE